MAEFKLPSDPTTNWFGKDPTTNWSGQTGSVTIVPTAPDNSLDALHPFINPLPRPDRARPIEEQPVGEATLIVTATLAPTTITMDTLGLRIDYGDGSDNDNLELERTTHSERITNPEDADQFVDVDVVDSLTFKNKLRKKTKFTLSSG